MLARTRPQAVVAVVVAPERPERAALAASADLDWWSSSGDDMRYAQLSGGTVVNVVECDAAFATQFGLTQVQGISPEPGMGWTFNAGVWAPPAVDPQLANSATLHGRAAAALTANANFLALATPTNAQVVAHVQQLTKECNALIRMMIGQLDSTSGT